MNADELLQYYISNGAYLSTFNQKGIFTDIFLKRYHQSLFYYKHFYDDFHEYGNRTDSNEVIYFIPGFNGTPGQIRFGFPGLIKRFGHNIYIKCLYLEEFSSKYPYWLKYTEENLEKRRDQIVSDLYDLSKLNKVIHVFVSSTAFYDFLSIYSRISDIKDRMILYWGASAPDSVSPTKWEKLFYKFNGFIRDGSIWYAYPNHSLLTKVNPECEDRVYWKNGNQRNVFFKNDIESRFFVSGLLWDYVSTDCFNFIMKSNLKNFEENGERVDMDVRILAATNDGFWDDSSIENIKRTMEKYIIRKRIIFKPTSHLWVVTPENIEELLR